MRLLTHNMLSSNVKPVKGPNGSPLRIEAEKVVEKKVEMNPDFLKKMFEKIHWKAFVHASRVMGYSELPGEVESSMLESDEFLQRFHHALLELHLEEGALVCPETGRRFPVNKGIPNMLLHEDEIRYYILSLKSKGGLYKISDSNKLKCDHCSLTSNHLLGIYNKTEAQPLEK